MQLIRIEHTDGYGMFISYFCNKRGTISYKESRKHVVDKICFELYYRHNKFNNPHEDISGRKKFKQGQHFCGYKTIEQLQQWIFPEEFKTLFKHGYDVYLIEVSECLEGEHQICYKKEHIIKKENISSLFKK